MKLTKEEAVRLFHEQWSDMQKELGDCPDPESRVLFKAKWCEEHFPGENVGSYCFLCKYALQANHGRLFDSCYACPIAWPLDRHGEPNCYKMPYLSAPISEILALPVREEVPNDTNETV